MFLIFQRCELYFKFQNAEICTSLNLFGTGLIYMNMKGNLKNYLKQIKLKIVILFWNQYLFSFDNSLIVYSSFIVSHLAVSVTVLVSRYHLCKNESLPPIRSAIHRHFPHFRFSYACFCLFI